MTFDFSDLAQLPCCDKFWLVRLCLLGSHMCFAFVFQVTVGRLGDSFACSACGFSPLWTESAGFGWRQMLSCNMSTPWYSVVSLFVKTKFSPLLVQRVLHAAITTDCPVRYRSWTSFLSTIIQSRVSTTVYYWLYSCS